nr:reverse transcriptase domain-containing protein [Tanacetum cinerariifolium]
MDHNINSFGFDQIQPPQYPVIHHSSQEIKDTNELLQKLLEDLQIISEELEEYINSPSWNRPTFYNNDEEHSIQYKKYLENSSNAITTVLPTKESEYSLSMGDEHLSTISETESDEVIKSSVKNLVQIPSEYEVTSDNESGCDVPVKDESSPIFTTFSNPTFDDFTSSDDELLFKEDVRMENFKIYSNPFFDDEEINSNKIDSHYFNVESNLIESLSNRDTLFDSSPKFDYLEEFSGELMPTSIINKERIKREHEEYISLMEKLLTINSFPRPLENFHDNTIIETLPTSPIPVEDNSEGDIHFLEELLSNDSISLPENESSNFDHHDDPSFPRPPPEPPDVEIFFEPDSSILTTNVVKENEDKVFKPGPFTITQVFPYGTVELSQPDGPNFKVNGHRVKHYFGGDIPSKRSEETQVILKIALNPVQKKHKCWNRGIATLCQPMDQNINSFGFDQIQPLRYPVIHHSSQEMSEEILQAKENLMKSIQTFFKKFNCISFREMPKVLSRAWEKFFEIQHAQPEDTNELLQKLLEDLQIIKNSSNAITTVLPTKEPKYSLSMGNEHLSTILETESDEVIKSSVKNLVQIQSEYEVTSDNESECDVSVKDESSPIFTTFSNPTFDDFTSSDDELLFKEDVPMENFKIYSNLLFDDEEINSNKIDPIISMPNLILLNLCLIEILCLILLLSLIISRSSLNINRNICLRFCNPYPFHEFIIMSNINNNMQTQTSNTLHNAIMEAGSKDRPPMLAPGNYVKWKSRIKRYIDTKPNHDLIHYCLENPPYQLDLTNIEVPVSEGSPITTTARIRIDNDIYSTVDDCPNACEMWKAIERLKQGESINVQDLETNLYWEFGKFTSQDGESLESYYSSRANQDNSLRINRSAGYENQRIGNVVGARENVGSSVVQKSGIQCYNCKEFGHVERECQKPKRAKDAAYHREKMNWKRIICIWHNFKRFLQMLLTLDLSLMMNHCKREEIDQNADDNDLATECDLLASLIEKLKCEIDESKNRNKFLETSNKALIDKLKGEIEDFKNKNISLESSNNFFKEANNRLSETNNLLYADYKKSEAELARRNNMEYASQMELECAKVRERSRLSHINVNNGKTKESFNKQTILLEKRMDESIPLDKQCQSSLEIFKDEVTNLQYDYLELLEKCEGLETELSKSKMMSKSFESVQKHAINLELELQQCKKKIKTEMLFKVNKTKDFCKEREQYFEIQDLKAQFQDKSIVISELKKLIEKLKGKSVDTKFEKSSVIRQPNAFKSQRPSVLGKPTTFSNSFCYL